MQVNIFESTANGYAGRARYFGITEAIVLVALDPSDAENAPDYRVHVLDTMSNETGAEIGAGWKRTGEKAGDYVSLQLDDPTFDHPIRANLFQSADDKSAWSLHWNRPPKRGERD